jgi:Ca-activated chloride channel family protein
MTISRSTAPPQLDELETLAAAGPDHDAGFGALETPRGRLPLAALDVTGRIDGLLSQVTVRQTFVNATDEPLEATYIFPLPDRAAVTDFRMEVAGRVVEGVLKERGHARRDYRDAIRKGHRASIAEEERPGVFTLRVGNLMPGDIATVQLTLVGILPYADGQVTFRFPLVVAPRYVPGVPLSGASVGSGTAVDTNLVPDASRIAPPVLLPGFSSPVRLSIAIDVFEPAQDLRVSLFSVWGEQIEGARRLIVRPGERLDRDFIVRFRLGGDQVQTSLSLHPDGADGDEGTFALTIVPPDGKTLGLDARRPRDVVLVLDRSGSMAGWRITAARRALARMVDTLNDSDRFAVIAFDNRIESPPFENDGAGLVAATDRNRFKAVEFLAKVEERGGTEIVEPLAKAVDLLEEVRRDRILVLVTDGQVANEDQVLQMLGARLAGIRVFTLGIDQAVNEGFLRRLAGQGAGGSSCELVESEDRLDAVMDVIHRRIGTPIVDDVHIEPGAGGLELVADTLVPDRAPCLFAGSPLLVVGRYRGRPPGSVWLRGTTSGHLPWQEAVVPRIRDHRAIAAAWARAQVRQLEDRYTAGRENRGALEKAILATSLRFGVLCRFTAFVAVDRSAVVNEGGEVHEITQPVEMLSDWDSAAEGILPVTSAAAVMDERMPGKAQRPVGSLKFAMTRTMSDDVCYSAPASASPPDSTADDFFRNAGFERLAKIGENRAGTLYNGRDRRGRPVVLLVLTTPVKLASGAAFSRVEKALKRLKHPAIVPILGLVGDARTGLVIGVVSEKVVAETLAHRLMQGSALDHRAVAHLVLALAEALEYAARQGIIHGDLTLENILIGDNDKPHITGFERTVLGDGPDDPGATARAAGTPSLAQSPGSGTTAQTDVLGLGRIFAALLTFAVPDGDQAARDPGRSTVDFQVPAELTAFRAKANSAAPENRYANAGELADDLRRFLGVKKPSLLRRLKGSSKPKPTPGPAAPPNEKDQNKGFWK